MSEKSFYNRPRMSGSFSPIAEKRIELGITQAQLAKLAGISTNQVSRIELGVNSPTLKSISKIAKALNCTIDELINP